jgi:hypothetical protein
MRNINVVKRWCQFCGAHGDIGFNRDLKFVRTTLRDEVGEHLCGH